jgi:hypothetical protein
MTAKTDRKREYSQTRSRQMKKLKEDNLQGQNFVILQHCRCRPSLVTKLQAVQR